ncbi:MAG: VanZ family protein [Bacteroidales bacterium]|jgi:VanZ family protein|nr:VanZ family protein [Bacteroidales bacterium]MDD3161726.1 VanZ family protein [Bacteroidales bacterium]
MKYHFNYILSLIIGAIILYLTLFYQPSDDNELVKIENMDKIVHGLMFFGFAWAVAFDYTRQQINKIHSDLSMCIRVFLLSIVYGGVIEVLQGKFFPERYADWKDFLSDAIGALVGLSVYLLFFKKYTIRYFSSIRKQK